MGKKFRTEKDSLGAYPVPETAWYGIQTARAMDNFPISGRHADPDFIIAHVRIKRGAATANRVAGCSTIGLPAPSWTLAMPSSPANITTSLSWTAFRPA